MSWKIEYNLKLEKQLERCHQRIIRAFQTLVQDLKSNGPAPGKYWSHYGKLHGSKNEDKRHCHLNKGHPTYVCCWSVNQIEKSIEVYYVGTHEKAPY